MTKYFITISYDGSKYLGLQKLSKGKTIQGELEKVLSKMNEEPVKVVSSGRTDRGVHAIEQVCSFELTKETDPYRLRYYLNRSTDPYLYVSTCKEIDDEKFHARFSVKSKTYKYIVNTGTYDPIKADYLYNYNKSLDIQKIKSAAKRFLGAHNFRAFVVGKHETCDSIIEDLIVNEENDYIIIEVKGKAFYTYMVRYIVAALILVGEGTLIEEYIDNMLQTGKREIEFAPAPPSGLYLEKIEY